MGPYLAKPETTIHTSNDENDRFIYCTAEMQGWRKTQEDAHSALLNYDDKGSAFFAVFDGHGGDEVSKYCALHFPPFIKKSLFQDQNIQEAIKKSFLEFDRSLKEPHVIDELRKIAALDDGIEEDETSLLRKEATMPIEQLVQPDIESISKDSKNGESSESTANCGDSSENTEESKTNSADKAEEGKNGNGQVAENSNHSEESKGSEKESVEGKPSTSGKSELTKKTKSDIVKALNKQIYEAFLTDMDDMDDESDDDEELEDEGTSDDSDNESDNEDEEEDEVDDEDEDDQMGPDPFANAYITPGGGSGCTAIVAIVRRNLLYVANIGDSRCVLSRNGTAIELSEDHKPEDPIETARIEKAGGQITDGRVNGGLNLSRAFGDHLYKKNESLPDVDQMVTAFPDIRTHEIDVNKDNFLFLACDGIWNSMNSQEVVDFIHERMQKNVELKTICEEIFQACLAPNTDGDGSGCDNMTCVLIKIKKDGETKRALEEDASYKQHSQPDQKKQKTSEEELDMFKPGSSKA